MMVLPYKRIVYLTNLEHQQVLDALVSVVGKKRSALKSPLSIFTETAEAPLKPYGGSVYKTRFDINPVLEYKSVVPFINGKIEPMPSGTKVQLTYYMHPFLLFFLLLWLAGAAYPLYPNTTNDLQMGNTAYLLYYVPIFLFVYFGSMLLFNRETRKSIRFFSELLKANPAQEV
jgi:hypothetical protein